MGDDIRGLAFIDVETTGLDPDTHDIWEIAYILEPEGTEITFQLEPDLLGADAHALRINQYTARVNVDRRLDDDSARLTLLEALEDRILVGNNVAFDAKFLREFIGSEPWHYHIVDVKALVAGRVGIEPPWSTVDLLETAGADTSRKHEALDDCRKARALYKYALGVESFVR